MQIIGWTGREARALRLALRLSERSFAERLGVSLRAVALWDARKETISLSYEMQAILDTCLARADDAVLARFTQLLAGEPPNGCLACCPRCGGQLPHPG